MKVEKLPSGGRHPRLWEFARDHLPDGLRTAVKTCGYGSIYEIHIKERGVLSVFSDPIATVDAYYDTIELRNPEWFSDFEDLCRAYETKTGREVTLRYWESA